MNSAKVISIFAMTFAVLSGVEFAFKEFVTESGNHSLNIATTIIATMAAMKFAKMKVTDLRYVLPICLVAGGCTVLSLFTLADSSPALMNITSAEFGIVAITHAVAAWLVMVAWAKWR